MFSSARSIASRLSVRPSNLRMYSGGAGSTGAFRGEAGSDSFTKRERASEDYFVHELEKERIAKLKAEIARREQELAHMKSQVAQEEGKSKQ